MMYYLDNKEVLESNVSMFSYEHVGTVISYLKPFNNTNLSNVTFFIDIENFDSLSDTFFEQFLGNNSIIFYREHKILLHNFANKLIEKIKKFDLDTKKIYITIAQNNQVEELENYLIKNGIQNVNFFCNMIWLYWPLLSLKHQDFERNKICKKFSIFSRRYADWRRNIYCDLLIRDILSECHYTFSNAHPDGFETPKTLEQMLENLPEYMCEHNDKIIDWLKNGFYSFKNDDPFDKKIYSLMYESSINIALETHITEQSCGVSITEKVYKPIIVNRPFIVYGIPNLFSMLKKEGFKTFDGIIDESYDTIIDPDERRLAIVGEIERINKLSDLEFNKIIAKCQTICDYNSDVVEYYKNRSFPNNFTNQAIFGSK